MILIGVLLILFLPFISYEQDHMNGVVTVEQKSLFTILKDNYIEHNTKPEVEIKDAEPTDTGEPSNEKK